VLFSRECYLRRIISLAYSWCIFWGA